MNISICVAAAALAVLALPAHAALGEGVETIDGDAAQLQAQRVVVDGPQYTIHELRLKSGAQVREYASPSGMVFAVTWQGPELPDLQQLLGGYFEPYKRLLEEASARGARAARTQDLVVQIGGHMRAYAGRVILLPLMPRASVEAAIR